MARCDQAASRMEIDTFTKGAVRIINTSVGSIFLFILKALINGPLNSIQDLGKEGETLACTGGKHTSAENASLN
jgi:hypothetical protein